MISRGQFAFDFVSGYDTSRDAGVVTVANDGDKQVFCDTADVCPKAPYVCKIKDIRSEDPMLIITDENGAIKFYYLADIERSCENIDLANRYIRLADDCN